MKGLCSKPRISDYWATGGIAQAPSYRNVLPSNRYQLISLFLHFCKNFQRVPCGEEGYDPLYKIAPLMNIVKPLYTQYYIPCRELTIDESMRKFKGWIYFHQYILNKPTRWGIKLWSLCESKSGYLLEWDVYTGRDNNPVAPDQGLGHNVVIKLMDNNGYLNLGHHLHVDNLYSSPGLLEALKEQGTGACGTVRLNRKGLPEEIRPARLQLKKGDDLVYYRKGDMLVCSWHNSARINFLSTIDTIGYAWKQIQSKQAETGFRDVKKPNVACNYNGSME
ncbi:piggyBac transposable element-derived protein 4-like [Limulus polyphemus]|uniref:PiggyBac transposable element-derived protein 4-like n=1 Tax=Limulus polyphemus TaxID=6850 RepID=A0ABM1BCF2_LIMPO|nr:piggyBac transposable element-derived protein 4-like [Limulus polyphemus]